MKRPQTIRKQTPKSIALICCYYGEFPWYFEYFIHSCKHNPSIDFFIITNNEKYDTSLPKNIRIIHKTYEQFNALASEMLGFAVNVSSGYKLNDFKPAYGLIFSNLISKYDFWGHIDIDIIFGNIRSFMTEELLSRYDLISVRPDWITGCFLLFKNELKMNTLFFNSKDHQRVLTEDRCFCFDETGFAHEQFSSGKSYLEIDTEIESMMHVVKKMEYAGHIKPHFDLFIIEGLPGRLLWENGKLTYRNEFEVLFYHLIFFKRKFLPPLPVSFIPNKFRIGPRKIYHKKLS